MKVIKDFKDLSLLRSEILNGNPNGVDILRIDGQAFSTDMQQLFRREYTKKHISAVSVEITSQKAILSNKRGKIG